MLRSSLRTRLLLVAIVFSGLVVGGMSLTTYVVVSDGMSVAAHDSTLRIAQGASEIAESYIARIPLAVQDPDAQPGPSGAEAREMFLRDVPDMFTAAGLSEGEFALWGAGDEPLWSSSEKALVPGTADARARAVDSLRTTEDRLGMSVGVEGLFGPADLGISVVHVPIFVPGGEPMVLDVVYHPHREESVIDAIRSPMTALAAAATLIMVVMMQSSMVWVLKLVDDLRKAADSIAAGRLDVRLPDEGDHEIGELARSINGLIDRLRRRADAQTRFVADASHELATPVAGIRGYTNILRAWGADDPEVRDEAISAIDRESRRMARLCSDLLSLLRNERGLEFRHVRFDINERCRETLAVAATRYIDKGLDFSGPDEGRLLMVGDPDRIEDVVSILVDNAAKYTPPGGSVSVRTRRRHDRVVVEVEDTGIGIPASDIDSVFDRFYRSDESRSKETGGVGLGLSIAKTIAEAAGGTIEVESAEGRGATFRLLLPRGRL